MTFDSTQRLLSSKVLIRWQSIKQYPNLGSDALHLSGMNIAFKLDAAIVPAALSTIITAPKH
jgi:hypothetical protein